MSAIPLLDLPYVPITRILRFLKNADLVKMLKTCRSMRRLVNRNRVPRRVGLTLSNRIRDDQVIVYTVNLCQIKTYNPFKLVYRRKISDCDVPSFFSWFAETFRRTYFSSFHFQLFDFTHEDLENFGKLWRKYELKTDGTLEFFNVTLGIPENYLKILSAMDTKQLVHYEEKVGDANVLLTDSFWKFMPSLDKFDVFPIHQLQGVYKHRQYKTLIIGTIPNQIDLIERLPRHCHINYNFVLDFGVLKRSIHHWWRHSEPFGYWSVSIPGQFRDGTLLARELELPAGALHHVEPKHIEIRSPHNRDVVVIRQSGYFKASDAAEWQFSHSR